MWTFNRCPKCGGDLFFEDGEYRCLQCAHTSRIEELYTQEIKEKEVTNGYPEPP